MRDLLIERLERLGIKRVLIVSHAATIIALGRAFLNEDEGKEKDGRSYYIGAGTATISKFNRTKNGKGKDWEIELNGNADHLPKGIEREWDFTFVPSNVEEEGMGDDWVDEELPEEASKGKTNQGSIRSKI